MASANASTEGTRMRRTPSIRPRGVNESPCAAGRSEIERGRVKLVRVLHRRECDGEPGRVEARDVVLGLTARRRAREHLAELCHLLPVDRTGLERMRELAVKARLLVVVTEDGLRLVPDRDTIPPPLTVPADEGFTDQPPEHSADALENDRPLVVVGEDDSVKTIEIAIPIRAPTMPCKLDHRNELSTKRRNPSS